MSHKKEFIKLKTKGYTYQQIGNKFNVSKQYVHQELMGYHVIRRDRRTARQLYLSIRKNPCINCGGKSIAIHHKDYNSKNNNINNLISVCKKCHIYYHTNKYRNKWSKKYRECINCKSTNNPYYLKGYCKICYSKILSKRKFAWSINYEKCISCFQIDRRHANKGFCTRCNSTYNNQRRAQRKILLNL